MSTLEELKKQASDVTQRNQVAAKGSATDEQQWHKLAAVMKFLKDHFTELAETLNVLEQDTLVDFEINDAVSLKRLKGQNYKITHPGENKERDFIFEFENSAEHPAYCLLPAGPAAAAFKSTLSDNQIQCSTTPVDGNKSIKFEIKPLVRTKYRFTANPEKENVSLTITNYNNIWSQTNYFKKTEVTTVLMDELTHHVMRKPNKYNEMVGNVISEEMRTKLRAKLKAEQTSQKAKAGQSKAQPAKVQQQAKKEKTLFGKIFKKK
jgi:hypothetical protein